MKRKKSSSSHIITKSQTHYWRRLELKVYLLTEELRTRVDNLQLTASNLILPAKCSLAVYNRRALELHLQLRRLSSLLNSIGYLEISAKRKTGVTALVRKKVS